MSDIWKDFAQQVAKAIDFRVEYEALGLRIGKQSGDSWTAFCPFHEDTNPSFSFFTDTGHWKCFSQCGDGSFSDFVIKLTGKEYKEILLDYARKYGIQPPQAPKPDKPVIKPELAEKYHQQLLLARERVDYLLAECGLTLESIKKYQIGWHEGDKRFTVPVLDEHKNLVNIRRYMPGAKTNKMLNWTDGAHRYGEARIYGLSDLIELPETLPVVICAGEKDRLNLEQREFHAVTGTAGEGTWKGEWNQYFKGRHVYVCYDNDDEGRRGGLNVAIALHGTAASVHIITLPDEVGNKGDVTDFFVKLAKTAEDFQDLMVNATEYTGGEQPKINGKVLELPSFAVIGADPAIVDRRVTVPITVCGETSESFHAVTEFTLKYCKQMSKSGQCYMCVPQGERVMIDGQSYIRFKVLPGEKEFIGACMSSEDQVLGMLRKRICPRGEKPQLSLDKKVIVKEFFAHQQVKRYVNYINEFEQDNGDEKNTELDEKKVYYVIDDASVMIKDVKPKSYLATGYVKTHPKTSQIALLVDKLEQVEDEHEKFKVEDAKEDLMALHTLREDAGSDDSNVAALLDRLRPIIDDVANNVIKVYHRDNVVFGMLLVFCSVLKIPFNEEFIRGWLNLVVVGDSGTAKSLIYDRIASYIGVGDITSATSSSRTGIVYGLREHAQKGWQLKAGRLPANSQKILCIDEIQKMERDDIGTLQKAMDDGWISIDRISTGGFETMTRLIALCNPKMDNAPMDTFLHGCLSMTGIFPVAFIRRLDFAVFTSADDIANYDEINTINTSTAPKITTNQLRALVFWAWTRRPEDIVIDKDVTALILSKASEFSKQFGACTDIPLVAPSDFRKNLARLAVACAVIDTSTDDSSFQKVIVRREHVLFMCEYLANVYSHENCLLDKYSHVARKKHAINATDYERFRKEVEGFVKVDTTNLTKRFLLLFIMSTHSIHREEVTEQLGCSADALKKRILLLKKFGLITSTKKGYKAEPTFNKFIKRLMEDEEATVNWQDLYDISIYSEENEGGLTG